jgi:hypothetical protein
MSSPSDMRRVYVVAGLAIALILGTAFFSVYLGSNGLLMIALIVCIAVAGAMVIRRLAAGAVRH